MKRLIELKETRDSIHDTWGNRTPYDIGVADNRIAGVREREVDRANKGRLGPKRLHGIARLKGAMPRSV